MHASLIVLSAGSLRTALPEYAAAHSRRRRAATGSDEMAELAFGPAGLLRRDIEGGRACDVYLSADTAHPEALARAAGTTSRVFARNPLRVVARRALGLTPDSLLDGLLDPGVRLGTSTPGADPSGDYALKMFERAEAMRRGAGAALRAKAMAVVGGAIPEPGAPAKERGLAQLFADGTIDAMIGYRTGAQALAFGPDGLELDVVVLPPALSVVASYGAAVLRADARATAFVAGLLAPEGAAILARHGFDPP